MLMANLIDGCEQVKRREDMYKKEKYMLDQKVAESKRGVEEEERRLASLATPEDLDRLTAEHNASIDDLRLEIQVLAASLLFVGISIEKMVRQSPLLRRGPPR